MKGKYGTSMQSIVYVRKKGNIHCKDCKYLKYVGGQNAPYVCTLKNKPRHYTSVVFCKKFKRKEPNQAEIDRWSKYQKGGAE